MASGISTSRLNHSMATPSPSPEVTERDPLRAERRARGARPGAVVVVRDIYSLPVSFWMSVTMPVFSSKNVVLAEVQPPKSLSIVSSFAGTG
jgi:hypothetical protein